MTIPTVRGSRFTESDSSDPVPGKKVPKFRPSEGAGSQNLTRSSDSPSISISEELSSMLMKLALDYLPSTPDSHILFARQGGKLKFTLGDLRKMMGLPTRHI